MENENQKNKNKHGTGMSFLAMFRVGTCAVCGCTEEQPCYDADYGYYCWTDENENLCSHCASPEYTNSLWTLRLMGKESFDE